MFGFLSSLIGGKSGEHTSTYAVGAPSRGQEMRENHYKDGMRQSLGDLLDCRFEAEGRQADLSSRDF